MGRLPKVRDSLVIRFNLLVVVLLVRPDLHGVTMAPTWYSNHAPSQVPSESPVYSGYNGEQARDLVESGLKGMKRKEEKRKKRCNRFRSAEETLEERETKKLIEATTWFKDTEKENENEDALKRRVSKENEWSVNRKTNRKRKRINEI